MGNTYLESGKLEDAEACFRDVIALDPDFDGVHNRLLRCLYLANKEAAFFTELDYLIDQNEANSTIGSLACRSALKYGVERPNLFCNDPLNYVLHADLNTRCDFQEVFVETARDILNQNKVSNRAQSLLKNGYQTTGNLFQIYDSLTKKLQEVIRSEIDRYQTEYKNSEEGLIKKWPAEYDLHAWLISMKSGGELRPHFHDRGWLSGSIYINVPPKSEADSGNLVVSEGEESDLRTASENPTAVINVDTGSLVLFPASLTHSTIPFEADEERIVLAFDVIPK